MITIWDHVDRLKRMGRSQSIGTAFASWCREAAEELESVRFKLRERERECDDLKRERGELIFRIAILEEVAEHAEQACRRRPAKANGGR